MIEPIFEIKVEKTTKTEGTFYLEPLEAGFGHTLGNALRRVLLSSLPGAAVTFVKINGAHHQFTSLPGMKEDLVEFVLNIKKLKIEKTTEGPVKINLDANGPGKITAAQIGKAAGIEIVNKDLVLANLADKKAKISCEMTVESGFGYSPFEDRKSETLGVIPVDALFSPVVRVNYRIETTRVGRVTDYDRLVLEVTTDGTVSPREAVKQSAEILIAYFNQVVNPKKPSKVKEKTNDSFSGALKLSVEELSLPTRITNALEKSGYKTVDDILNADDKHLAQVKNLGEKSVKIIQAALKEKGVGIS